MSGEEENSYSKWEQTVTNVSVSPRPMTSETLHEPVLPDQPLSNSSVPPASPTSSMSAADASFLQHWYLRVKARLSPTGVSSLDNRYGRKFTLGERVADAVSQTMGSWRFVITQSTFLAIWLVINASQHWAWDPYPFILLNLMLSFQAAYTAPIIMMSQNRQADIDRVKASDLHEKVDHIRLQQVSSSTANTQHPLSHPLLLLCYRSLLFLALLCDTVMMLTVSGVGHLGSAGRHATTAEGTQAGRG